MLPHKFVKNLCKSIVGAMFQIIGCNFVEFFGKIKGVFAQNVV